MQGCHPITTRSPPDSDSYRTLFAPHASTASGLATYLTAREIQGRFTQQGIRTARDSPHGIHTARVVDVSLYARVPWRSCHGIHTAREIHAIHTARVDDVWVVDVSLDRWAQPPTGFTPQGIHSTAQGMLSPHGSTASGLITYFSLLGVHVKRFTPQGIHTAGDSQRKGFTPQGIHSTAQGRFSPQGSTASGSLTYLFTVGRSSGAFAFM